MRGVAWFQLTQNNSQLLTYVDTMLNLSVPWKGELRGPAQNCQLPHHSTMEFNKYFKEKISLTKNYKYFQFWQPKELRLQITGDILRTDYRKHHSLICW
jgi:hypothetical protein